MIKILKINTYIDLIAKVEQYKSLLELERKISAKEEAQIEKMKCCWNCKHEQNKLEDNEVCWNCERGCSMFGEEIIKDEWELAE